ncbi:hypothetical protein BKA82DRAFT_2800264 [Pisolithus tinctorius]|nr:hypothetical protein BKA82DRAFT_2800264 [Pisolithus tinctorius]
MGPMSFVSGSHLSRHAEHLPISDESDEYIRNLVEKENLSVHPAQHMNAGDATLQVSHSDLSEIKLSTNLIATRAGHTIMRHLTRRKTLELFSLSSTMTPVQRFPCNRQPMSGVLPTWPGGSLGLYLGGLRLLQRTLPFFLLRLMEPIDTHFLRVACGRIPSLSRLVQNPLP